MVLELVNITKTFSGFVIGPLNLKIADDDILVMIGPTGNGKTTILNLIMGLIKPDSGSIFLNGMNITNMPVESRNIGYLFQRPSLFPFMNVYENITFGLKKEDKKKKDFQIKMLLENLGISHLINRGIQGLSGGEMQKISLARTLIIQPKIMLMDEPLANLDDPTKRKLRVEIRQVLKKQKISCIYVTHFEDDVYALADSVAILKNGRIDRLDKLGTLLSYSNHSSSPFLSDILDGGYNYIEGNVVESKNGVTKIRTGSHILEMMGNHSIGSMIGVLVRPEDIILSVEMVKTSARNVIKAKIKNITNTKTAATGFVDIHLVIGDFFLVSKITNESRNYLGIEEGDYVYAMFKATSPQVIREGKWVNEDNRI
ncbi:MAG: ABC transporter ATP-binding protein [Thermoproteota archaeon]|nr:ABC transporter ATP-binding protein [Thermoproteota archaeon]